MALIENDDCIQGITNDHCAIIVFVTVPVQSLLVSCLDGIYLHFQYTQTYVHIDGVLPLRLSLSWMQLISFISWMTKI